VKPIDRTDDTSGKIGSLATVGVAVMPNALQIDAMHKDEELNAIHKDLVGVMHRRLRSRMLEV